ncbi:MAG: hypothetical protein H8E44_17540 [Planctomycetes bacterium]|nr:hypothetical protein [Planctomycetota bacterium]
MMARYDWWKLLGIYVGLFCTSSPGAEPSLSPDLLFRASFDRLAAFADYARGKPESTLDQSLELRAKPGVKGHCLLVEEGEQCVYDAQGNFDLAAGTISLWVKPANWSDQDGRYVAFLNVYGRVKESDKGFGMSIDKSDAAGTARAHLSFGSRQRHPDYKLYLALGKAAWQPDTWHKLDVTWDSKHLAIYVDGKLSNKQDLPDVPFPELVNPKIELVRKYPTAPSNLRNAKDQTYIDELEIYKGAHSAARVLERYLADKPEAAKQLADYRSTLKDLRGLRITYVPDVPRSKLGIELDLANLDPEWLSAVKAGKASLNIETKGPSGDESRADVQLTGPAARAELPCQFPEGVYSLTYTIGASDNEQPLVVEDTLEVPNLEWVGSNVGVSDEVLDPWTPLAYDGDHIVGCWGRQYEFAGPLPSRVVNQGDDILRGPMTLTLKTPTTQAALIEESRKAVQTDSNRGEFTGTSSFEGTGAAVEWNTWIEYDGLVVSTFTITPPDGGLGVASLTMNIPLRTGLKYIRGARKSPNRLEWDGLLWESHFEPFLWISDEDEGFLYFCESDANWVYPSGQPVTVVRGGEEPSIELRIINQPVEVTKPIRYQFGFQATPVKPLMKGWREMNFGPGLPIRHQTHQPWMNGYAYYTGLWQAARPDRMRQFDQERHDKGILTFYYATTSCTPNHNPAYKLFKTLWNDPYPAQFGPYGGKETGFMPATPTHHLVPVCPGAPTLVEYEVWLAKKLHEQVGAAAFYTDCDGIWPCENSRHGCGFTDAFGRTGVSWSILGKRHFAKRMATLCRQIRRDGDRGYWMTHAHSKLVPPVHCFADFFWPGEEYTHRLYGNRWYYIDDMPEADYRVQLSGDSSGLVHIFLPEFKRGTKDPTDVDQPQPTASLLAMCAVNDVNTSASYMHLPSMGEWWGIRKKLGLNEAEFIAYWREDCPVQATGAGELASVYKWPRRAAVAVANRLPGDADVTVRIGLDELGFGSRPVMATDARTGKTVDVSKDRFTVPVRGRDYTFVSLTPRS